MQKVKDNTHNVCLEKIKTHKQSAVLGLKHLDDDDA